MGGISLRSFGAFRKLCGDSTLRNVVIVTNMWGEILPEIGNERERQLETDRYFGSAIAAGAKLLRHYNTIESAEAILRQTVHNGPISLPAQQEIVDGGHSVVDHNEVQAQEARHRKEKEELRRELEATKWVAKLRIHREQEEREKEIGPLRRKLETTQKEQEMERNGWDWERQNAEWDKDLEWKKKAAEREWEEIRKRELRERAYGRSEVETNSRKMLLLALAVVDLLNG